MKAILEILLLAFAVLSLLLTRFALFRLRQPTTLTAWIVKVFTSALSPILFLAGLLMGVIGLTVNSLPLAFAGGLSALLYLIHIIKIARSLERDSGPEIDFTAIKGLVDDEDAAFLTGRYVLLLPNCPEPVFHQNISFYTTEDSDRDLLCDVWQPPEDVARSGLAFIYLHGSAWAVLDKDFGTRTFFRHLAAQGHVIMDVAYRLYPEADFTDMVHDVKHAIAWMKTKAGDYGIDPDRIVIGGGSAGAHLALLAAYTGTRYLTPADLENSDLSVCGVISLYGQSDLAATYYHTCQHVTTKSALPQRNPGQRGGLPSWIQKRMASSFHRLGFDKNVEPGMLSPMLGGGPDDVPEQYSLYSPIAYVHSDCPPTLFIHGEHDILAPLRPILLLGSRLREKGVPVAIHSVPQTDHAFDLILPRISPSAQNAIYDVERFLAVLAYGSVFSDA